MEVDEREWAALVGRVATLETDLSDLRAECTAMATLLRKVTTMSVDEAKTLDATRDQLDAVSKAVTSKPPVGEPPSSN